MNDEYRQLYQELQRRMSPGGELSPGTRDTEATFRRSGVWDLERLRMHRTILDQFKERYGDRPRDGHAVLLTAGAPGAGKGGAQANLTALQGRDTEIGRELARAHGVNLDDYVVLDPDQFKVAIFRHGGLPQLDAQSRELPFGREVTPSEMASLIHRESAFVQDEFERWARGEGYNLLYDATLKNEAKNTRLLTDLADQGYDKRVILSVEVPLEQCLQQNHTRWESGRKEFEQGRDDYGGRMAPEAMIKDLYQQSSTGRGYSIGRENAERLADKGLVTGLITSDRGTFTTQAPAPVGLLAQAPAFQQGDTTMRIAAAGRLRSTTGTTGTTGTPVQPATRPAPQAPHTPHHQPGPGRTR
ncbi:zeta toxin family protein [Streptomyces sp. NPDC058611]|uniref:zeta toxin family protein n=1 Tax=Streptomyces sp. NPDC058611 TaxID=3346554 RepID=UPI0036476227